MSGPERRSERGQRVASVGVIPEGTVIHNIELVAGHGAQIVRSAGGAAQLMAKEREFCQVRLLYPAKFALIPSQALGHHRPSGKFWNMRT